MRLLFHVKTEHNSSHVDETVKKNGVKLNSMIVGIPTLVIVLMSGLMELSRLLPRLGENFIPDKKSGYQRIILC